MNTKYNCTEAKYPSSLSDCLLYLISVYLQSFTRNGSLLITYVPKISFNGPLFKFQKGSNQKFSLFLHLNTCNRPIQQGLIWRNLVLSPLSQWLWSFKIRSFLPNIGSIVFQWIDVTDVPLGHYILRGKSYLRS